MTDNTTLNEANITVGTVLTIDNRPSEATVMEVGRFGVWILTEDRCRIPFTFEELNGRNACIVSAEVAS